MIKTAQDAYLAGRQAAMEKLSKVRWGVKNPDGSVTYQEGEYTPTGWYSNNEDGIPIYSKIIDDGGPRGPGLESMTGAVLDPIYDRAMAAREAIRTGSEYAADALANANDKLHNFYGRIGTTPPPESMTSKFLGLQADIAGNVGIGAQGLLAAPEGDMGEYNPMRLATMENLSRLGILGGAAGGTYIGGSNPRAAAVSSAGALGGAQLGGNLGAGVNAALSEYGINGGHGYDDRRMQAALGAIGGLGGGLAAGKYLS